MVKIGINQNVYISKVGYSDKGAFELYFSDQDNQIQNNPFENLSKNEIVDSTLDTRIMLFPFNPPEVKDTKGNVRTEEKRKELVGIDVQDTKNLFQHLLEGYMTKDKINWVDMWDSTGITSPETYNDLILDKATLERIFRNLTEGFTRQMGDFIGDSSKRFRLKLIRQSKDKAFATIGRKFLKDNPIWEPMDIAEAQSKVKFNKYEKDNGLDSDEAPTRASADAPAGDAAVATTMDPSKVFGQR